MSNDIEAVDVAMRKLVDIEKRVGIADEALRDAALKIAESRASYTPDYAYWGPFYADPNKDGYTAKYTVYEVHGSRKVNVYADVGRPGEGVCCETGARLHTLYRALSQAALEIYPAQVQMSDALVEVERSSRQRALAGGLHEFYDLRLKGWNCPKCRVFNGEEKEHQMTCRCCDTERPL